MRLRLPKLAVLGFLMATLVTVMPSPAQEVASPFTPEQLQFLIDQGLVEKVETVEVDETTGVASTEISIQGTAARQLDGNIVWTVIAAILVFLMQAGFGCVEAGFTRAKNAVNIIMKNVMDFSMGSIAFFFIGFSLMFGPTVGGWIGWGGFGVGEYGVTDGAPDYWTYAFLLFQTVFAATAATIVSGAMAERTRFQTYIVFSILITAVIYPISGSWAWGSLFQGSGWLEDLGFIDFAGSTVVHSVGGWAALAGAICLGPRLGKYSKDGRPRVIPGHNLPLAALGVFILWFGWFGFNPGSTTTFGGQLAHIAVTTNLAAAAGGLGAVIASRFMFGKFDAGMAMNGVLSGLVAITSPCADVDPSSAILIGAVGGVICVFAVLFFENRKIDDPVGAISVHGVNGAWGTLAAGLFANPLYQDTAGLFFGGGFQPVLVQLTGIVAVFIWAFTASFIMFKVLDAVMGLRVSEDEEYGGLDVGEHGSEAYGDFSIIPGH